jgi:hypothetical protein
METFNEETNLTTNAENKSSRIIDIKLHPDDVKCLLTKCILLFLFIDFLSYIPGMLIIFTRNEETQVNFFHKIWWLIIIGIIFHYTISIIVYIKKDWIYSSSILTTIFFILYVSSITLINSVVAFYSPEVTLAYSSILAFGLIIILILNYITILDNKGWIKLSFVYAMVFTYLLIYMALVKRNIVEFFVLCVALVVFFAYVELQFKYLLKSIHRQGKYDNNVSFNGKFYACSVMFVSVDILICVFR